MKTSFARLLLLISVFACVGHRLQAQAVFAAERTSSVEVGAGFLYLNPDAVPHKVYGARAFGTFNFNRLLGVDAEYNMGSIVTPDDISETTMLVGPRATYHHHRLAVYGKLLGGIGRFTNNPHDQPGFAYEYANNPMGVYAFGGGIEYTLKRRIKLRPIDIEAQKWGNFAPHTLTPILATFGVSYVIR